MTVDKFEMPDAPLRGVIAVASTPFTADLTPNHDALVSHCRWLFGAGCDGISPIGSVGEGASLSLDERLAILDALAASGLPLARLVPETGCCALPDTIALTRRAVALGMGGAMLIAPYFYKHVSDDGLLNYFARVIDAVGDDRLRLYLFDFASVTGVPLSADLIGRLKQRFPGVLRGLKGGGGDIDSTLRLIREQPDLAVYTGWEKLLLANLAAGGGGGWSATANLTCRRSVAVHRLWREGRLADAEAAQRTLAALADAITARGAYAALKAVLAAWSGAPAWRLVRPPLSPLTSEQTANLVAALTRHGLRGFAD